MDDENFHGHFWTNTLDDANEPDLPDFPQAASMAQQGVPARWCAWGRVHDRSAINKKPHAANRFGWIFEVDLRDPKAKPGKHIAR